MERHTSFDAIVHGFRFPNFFEVSLCFELPLVGPIDIGRIIYGLCGGMSYAALDYFHADISVPTVDTQPAFGDPLYAYLWRRQLDTLRWPDVPMRILEWMLRKDADVARRTCMREFPKVRRRIDKMEPAVLLLIRGAGVSSPTVNHQVVATGYVLDETTQGLRISLYDPNYPGETPELTLNLSPAHREEAPQHSKSGAGIRGFFVLNYRPRKRELPTD